MRRHPDDVRVRDVRWVHRPDDVHSPRRSVVLAIDSDEAWLEVASVEGEPADYRAVEIRVERRDARLLGLTKTSYFRLDRIEWVEREQVDALVVTNLCPPEVFNRIRRMQADAALGVEPTSFY